LSKDDKEKLKELSAKNKGTGKAILLDSNLEEIKKISTRGINSALRKLGKKPFVIIMDDTATGSTVRAAEEAGCVVMVAKNFTTTDTKLELLSF